MVVELTYDIGGSIVKYKVDDGIIYLSGPNTNYVYIELVNPKKVDYKFKMKLMKTKGPTFVEEWEKDLKKYENLSDEEIVEELRNDAKLNGWNEIRPDDRTHS